MKVHFFQHDPVDGPGFIESWLLRQGHQVSWTRFYASPILPDVHDLDLLIILGGPMSVNDEVTYPWLRDEKSFIRRMILTGKPILGICLGAQLIASSLGAKVYKSPHKEIGWFSLSGIKTKGNNFFSFPPVFDAFQWHEETFDLPRGATLLAESEACKNQAFQLGRNVLGLQFHLEVTPRDVKAMTDYCLPDLVPSQYVQSQREILSYGEETYETANRIMTQILSFLILTSEEKGSESRIRAGP